MFTARVVAAHRGDELGDAGRSRICRELTGECRSDATTLVRVRNGEGDLRRRSRANEPGDADRLHVAIHVADEDVVIGVDTREPCELELGEPRLRAAEATLARSVSETREERRHGGRVAVAQWPDRDPVHVPRLHGAMTVRRGMARSRRHREVGQREDRR